MAYLDFYRRPLRMPAIGARVLSDWHAPGLVLVVVQVEPHTRAMTDTLCKRPDGSLCWYAAYELRPDVSEGK